MPYNLNIRGWMKEIELKEIEEIAKLVPDNETIIEVGSMMGRTAYCWAATKPSCKVVCFDQWMGESLWPHPYTGEGLPQEGDSNTLETFISNTKELTNITPITTIAPNFPETDNPFLVFIDIIHYNPCDWDTIAYFLPRIKNGGILCGHDYEPRFQDVIDNTRRLEKMLNQQVTLYENTTLWSFKI